MVVSFRNVLECYILVFLCCGLVVCGLGVVFGGLSGCVRWLVGVFGCGCVLSEE